MNLRLFEGGPGRASYMVKDIFGPTIQGEGGLAGVVTSFVRLSGCNMWDGRAETKAASACPYCDTDFVGGERLTAAEVVARVIGTGLKPGSWVTVSGGEPLLQADVALLRALRAEGFLIAVETNGTRVLGPLAQYIDHVACSPKAPPEALHIEHVDALKVLWPHPDPRITPEAFDAWAPARNAELYLQPINDVDDIDPVTTAQAINKLVKLEPGRWRLSIQLHKFLGVK